MRQKSELNTLGSYRNKSRLEFFESALQGLYMRPTRNQKREFKLSIRQLINWFSDSLFAEMKSILPGLLVSDLMLRLQESTSDVGWF